MKFYDAMARLLEYPGPDCAERIADVCAHTTGEMQTRVQAFSSVLERMGISRLQEIYIETFEFRAETSPYIGHHLFGEEIRRNLFMAELSGRYRECGIAEAVEMPDHLSRVLSFLGATEVSEERVELIHICLVPALQKLLRALKPDNPYLLLLEAILLAFWQELTSVPQDRESAWASFYSSSSPTLR